MSELVSDHEVLDRIPDDELQQALKFYTDFHWGFQPDKLYPIEPVVFPPALAMLGYWRAVVYQSAKMGDAKDKSRPVWYVHTFKPPFPILASDPQGNQIFVVGGGYQIEPRGITG